MSYERRRHFRVEKLTSEGKKLVDSLLGDRNSTYRAVAAALQATTGERVGPSVLQRYHHSKRSFFLHREPDQLYILIREALGKFNAAELQILGKLLISLADVVNQRREPQ